MEFIVNCYNKIDVKLSWEGKMMKTIRKTAIVMLLCVYFLTYGVLPQVEAAGKNTPVIVVAHRAGAKVAPENTLAALEQAIRDGAPIACLLYTSRKAAAAYSLRDRVIAVFVELSVCVCPAREQRNALLRINRYRM